MSEHEIDRAVTMAAAELGARRNDVQGYYEASGDWDADTVESLQALIVECWREQEASL